MTPVCSPVKAARRLNPRAAVMVGLAGIMAAIAVITASHAPTAPSSGRPAVHASGSPPAAQAGR